MLCVLLGHALLVLALRDLTRPKDRPTPTDESPEIYFISQHPTDDEYDDQLPPDAEPTVRLTQPQSPAVEGGPADTPVAGESGAIVAQGYVDWPRERRDAAARVLAADAEAERIARMFAGPQGTWASLTKREREQFNHFRWKPGINGLERDEKGNTIYRMKSGCTMVNFVFIGCPIGKKPEPYGDLFKDMRKYFDEQRLPQTDEGNGREPESMRPPRWSKPLP